MTEFYDSDDWRTKCLSLSETHAEARKTGMFVDVRFLVGQSSTARYFNAHKMMLACGSPVFEAMLFGQLAEKKDPIVIPDDDPEAFEIMLQHFYGEFIVFQSIVVACKSYSIADKYLITELKTKSTNFIMTSAMDDENFWGIIEGDLLNNEFVDEKFRSYIELNAEKLIKSKEFLRVPEYIVQIFLETFTMHVSEFELLLSVTEWCLKKFGQDIKLKSKTLELLQYIRLSVLTPKEFCLFTEKFPNVLDDSTSLKILKQLIDPSSYGLPVWCTTTNIARRPTKPEPAPLTSNVLLIRSTRIGQALRPIRPPPIH